MEMKRLKSKYDAGTNTIMIDSVDSSYPFDDPMRKYDKNYFTTEIFNKKIDNYFNSIKSKSNIISLPKDYNFPYEKKGYSGVFKDDEGWNKQMESVRKIVEQVAQLDRRRKAGTPVPIILPKGGFGALPHRQLTPGECAVVEHAVNTFNALIPREGVPFDCPSVFVGKGTFWRVDSTLGTLTARITIDSAFPLRDVLPPVRMNGVRRIKKSENVLSELVIERLYVIDEKGNELTLFSIV
jgi:hypothetical protein